MNFGLPLAGRKVVVTGASRGMGRAITVLLAAQGARVVAVARHKEVHSGDHRDGDPIVNLAVDLTEQTAASRIMDFAESCMGGLDVLVNAAGTFEMGPIDVVDDDLWTRAFATNFEAPRALCVAAIPALKRSGSGRIINIGSVAVRLTQSGMAAYSCSKHALTGLTMSLAVELGGFGITANIIHPGFILTDMSRALADDPVLNERVEAKIAARRMGRVDEIAHAISALARTEASYTSGQAICVDGGYSAGVYDLF